MRNFFILLFCSLTVSSFSKEYTVATVPNPKTANNSYVSNPDAILSAETVYQINTILDTLEAKNGTQVAVVVLNSIGNESIEVFATALFKEWGIGSKKNNNGLLILFVMDQRLVKFETGYGLEGVLPDIICSRIQKEYMIPEFKKGNYDAGFLAAIQKTASLVRNEPFDEKVVIPWNEILPLAAIGYLILMVLSFIWVNSSVRRIRANSRYTNNIARYKALKSEKTSIVIMISALIPIVLIVILFLFKFPLYWMLFLIPVPFTTIPANIYARIMMLKIRRAPIKCNECDGTMHLLSEKKEDAHLKLAQQFEEQLHAVDYDVFVCDSCKNEAIFTLDKPSAYSNCPKCGTKAFILKEKRIMVAPTYISSGTERKTYQCKFCGYEEHHNDNIPRLQRNSSAVVGGAAAGSMFSSGRGGFGGGGGFSGGSFGGGMSGGGGATSGW